MLYKPACHQSKDHPFSCNFNQRLLKARLYDVTPTRIKRRRRISMYGLLEKIVCGWYASLLELTDGLSLELQLGPRSSLPCLPASLLLALHTGVEAVFVYADARLFSHQLHTQFLVAIACLG